MEPISISEILTAVGGRLLGEHDGSDLMLTIGSTRYKLTKTTA